ncbi:MAG: DUF885 domain-containing protein [Myxococcaceae bacterium]
MARFFRMLLLFSVASALTACATTPPHHAKGPGGHTVDDAFQALLDADWEANLSENPLFATSVGDKRFNAKLEDSSWEGIERRKARERALLAHVQRIDPQALSSEAQRLNYTLFRRDVEERVEGQTFPLELLRLSQLHGVHADMADLAEQMPKQSEQDFQDFVARLRAFPRHIDDVTALLLRALAEGLTPPRVVLRRLPEQVAAQAVARAQDSPIYENTFRDFPPSLVPAKARIEADVRAALNDAALPALRKFDAFVRENYVPKARETTAWHDVKNGREWYAFLVRHFTTTRLSPEAIHALGQSEVMRIRAEMEVVRREAKFSGDLRGFFKHLREDKRFFFSSAGVLISRYRELGKQVDPQLPKLFGKLPRQPYGVLPVPAYAEKAAPAAYYVRGAQDAGRPGYFYANTYDLKARPKWEMEALLLHEAVPGHHLQIALAQELEAVPKFRRYAHYTAFIEGWALYAESLGNELGLYQDADSRMGRLGAEMLRAIRLVVDTGMHAMGWSREQAITFFRENSTRPEHDIVVEVDRYLAWPGQALAYKVGELKLQELRKTAAASLGAAFDVRAFHDEALGAGALPLDVLEARLQDWMKLRGAAQQENAAAVQEK